MELVEYGKMDKLETDHWWFVAKREFILSILKKNYPDLEGKKMLDIGCGTGALMQSLENKKAVAEGVDMSVEALKYCSEKKLSVKLGRAEKIEFADGSFDAVIASDILEHIEDDKAAVHEIKRVLKPGGIFILTVPAHPFLFSYHDKVLHHVRRYTKKSLSDLLKTSFEHPKITWIHCLILFPAIIHRLVARGKSESDVKAPSYFINKIMKAWYVVELAFFKLLFYLPWGLSLIAVAKKENYEKA